jgi:hypothetical protein
MPEDRLAERLAFARRLASEARLDRLDEALAGCAPTRSPTAACRPTSRSSSR